MAIQNISLEGAPLLWSNAKHAFEIANQNFEFLEHQLGLNTFALDVDLIPAEDLTYNIGTPSKRWQEIYVRDIYSTNTTTDTINIGGGQINVVNHQLVFTNEFNETITVSPSFRYVNIAGQQIIGAADADTLTFEAGENVTLTTDPITKTVTISSKDDSSLTIIDSSDITSLYNPATDETSLYLVSPNKFTTIDVAGAAVIVADSNNDTLSFDEGYGIVLTGNAGADTITIGVDPQIDIYGSVYSEDSTLLVDAVNGSIPWAVLADVPSFERDEFTQTFAVAGTYTLDTYDGAVDQTAEYSICTKAAEGIHYSTVATVYDDSANAAFSSEYGIILTTGTAMATYAADNTIGDTVTVTITVLYDNTTVTFKKTSLSNG